MDVAVVSRCKKLLTYPARYRDMMLRPNPDERVKADFFIELYPIISDQAVRRFVWFKRDYIIERMLDKYFNRKSGIKSVTDFRKMKQHITAAKRANYVEQLSQRFKEFCEDDGLDLSHLEIRDAGIHQQAEKITKDVSKIYNQINSIDPDLYYGESDLWRELVRLRDAIDRKLKKIQYRS